MSCVFACNVCMPACHVMCVMYVMCLIQYKICGYGPVSARCCTPSCYYCCCSSSSCYVGHPWSRPLTPQTDIHTGIRNHNFLFHTYIRHTHTHKIPADTQTCTQIEIERQTSHKHTSIPFMHTHIYVYEYYSPLHCTTYTHTYTYIQYNTIQSKQYKTIK